MSCRTESDGSSAGRRPTWPEIAQPAIFGLVESDGLGKPAKVELAALGDLLGATRDERVPAAAHRGQSAIDVFLRESLAREDEQ